MTDREKVAIFWDFENCCPPTTQGLGYDIANNIGRIARIFGSVTTFRAYLDISSQPPRSTALRSELQLSGVSVVDCPHNGKKDVVDKMAIVDMFAFAVDHPPPATVILVAGDRDYAYALSTLRLRNYKVVLITPRAPNCLEACASFVVDWNVALTKTRMESSTDSVRRPYVDMEASLFDRLSREVSQFCDNSTVASGPPEDMKPQQISAQGLTRPSFSDNDASVTSVSGFTQESSEGVVQHINGNNSSAVSVTSTSKIPASSRRPSTSLPSSLRTRSASIRSEAVSKPSNESSRLVAERLLPPDTCLEISDDTDAITGCSDPFIPNGVENQSSKSEPFSSIPTGSSNTEAPQLPATVDHSARPHVVPLPNPKSDLSPITSTLSRTRANSDGTVVPVGDTSQKMNVVDMAILEIEKMTASLPMSSPAIPGVGAEPTARCPPKSDHPPSGVPTVGRISSPLCQSSLQRTRSDSGRNIPPVSASGDNTDVRAETSSTNSAPTLTATSLSMGRLTTATNSVEGISKESMGSDNPSSVSPPALHAASDMVPGSPVTQEPTLPVSSMPTSTVTEQATREQIRRQFLPLIRLLVADRHRGIFHSSRSDIARELQVDDDAYKRVGATRFKPYAALAQRAGLVVLGGDERRRGDNTWIALHPDWFSEAEKTEFQSNAEIGCDSRAVGENLTSTSGEIGVGCRCV